MNFGTIDVTYENDEGDEIVLSLPATNEVCNECDGFGYVLMEGLRGHCFSMEEFEETFEDVEERSEYFRRGGRYDTTCETCGGKNVILVIDNKHIPADKAEEYKTYLKHQEIKDRIEAQCLAEERAERRMMGYD